MDLLDGAVGLCIRPWLKRWISKTSASTPLFNFTISTFKTRFDQLAAQVNLRGTHPYQISRGAASLCAYNETRPFKDIQERLCHLQESSTRRYTKKTRYMAQLSALPTSTRNYGQEVWRLLLVVMAGRAQVPRLPASGAGERAGNGAGAVTPCSCSVWWAQR